jgi:hypothetical protein
MKPNTSPDPDLPAADAGALLLPSSPPPSTVRVLIPHGCTWTTRDVPGATRVDITLTPRPRSRRRGGRR